MTEEQKLLKEILEILEFRCKGHVIVYSMRLLHLIPKIKKLLQS